MARNQKKSGQGSEFVRWFRPLMECLRDLGSVKPREASDWIAEKENISKAQREALISCGAERFHNQVQFARQYLVWEGLIDGSKRGVWSLTPLGLKTRLTDHDAVQIVKKWVKIHAQTRGHNPGKPPAETPEDESEIEESELLRVLRGLSPTGFEHICRRLLLSYGFEKVTVTKRTRDGGIDGEGLLQINPFVSSVVVFQCKKYRHSVSSEEITSLRGAAGGRADKALLITTGTFSAPAKAEAVRVHPRIELIDGEQLVAMFEEKKLGLNPRTVFDIDHSFFDQFR